MSMTLARLRQLAVGYSLQSYDKIADAMSDMQSIQYDPITSPVRAQDLILFQRVKGYQVKDIDTYYAQSNLEEDCLHVYGAVSKKISSLLHPRPHRKNPDLLYQPKGLSADILSLIQEKGSVVAKDVTKIFGRQSITNDWGGKSSATTQLLDELHYYGYLRILKRVNGNKVYKKSNINDINRHKYSANKRLKLLTKHLVKLLSPISEFGLRRAINQLCSASGGLAGRATVIEELMKAGDICTYNIDGVSYYMPSTLSHVDYEGSEKRVRFLSPFDPVVWDRDRFKHFWGWEYRFEAYMPKHLRRYGYYALPMFWRGKAIGWVNIRKNKTHNQLEVERGFALKHKANRSFELAYDEEVNRFQDMLLMHEIAN